MYITLSQLSECSALTNWLEEDVVSRRGGELGGSWGHFMNAARPILHAEQNRLLLINNSRTFTSVTVPQVQSILIVCNMNTSCIHYSRLLLSRLTFSSIPSMEADPDISIWSVGTILLRSDRHGSLMAVREGREGRQGKYPEGHIKGRHLRARSGQ